MGDGRDFDPTKEWLNPPETFWESGNPRPPFEVGDIVKLKTGSSPQRVLAIRQTPSGWRLRAVYLSSEHYLSHSGEPVSATWKRSDRFEHHELQEQQKQENEMNTLYQVIAKAGEEIRFGTFLARNSSGQVVLEMKGTGKVEAFDPSGIEIVRPYTVRVRFTSDTNKTRAYDYIAVKGSVEVGDLILQKDTGQIVRVTAIDTKASGSLKPLRGRKLVTEILEEADMGETVVPEDEGDED